MLVFLLFSGTCYSAEVCHHKSDVVVVFELPKTGDVEALEQIKQTIGALNVEYQNGDCIQLAFDIVSTTIDKVQYLGCHGLCRKAYTAMKIDDILSKLRRTTDIDRFGCIFGSVLTGRVMILPPSSINNEKGVFSYSTFLKSQIALHSEWFRKVKLFILYSL